MTTATKEVTATEAVEALIDKHGLLHVLTSLELVCAEKAEHIRNAWQDRLTAKHWDQASTIAGRAARQIHSGL